MLEPRLLLAGWTGAETARTGSLQLPADQGAVAALVGPLSPALATRPDPNSSDDDAVAPLSTAPYLIVPEATAFHGTQATAQVIPDVPYVGVEGMFGSGEPIDLYRVVTGPGALVLRLAQPYDQTRGSPLLRLSVYNALGRLIGMATASNGVVNLTFAPAGSNLAPGSAVFVGVSALGPAGGEPSGVDYQLWFLRTPDVSTSGLGLDTVAPRVGGEGMVTVTPSLVSGPGTVSPGSSQLPALAAAPSGGVLSDSVPTRTVALAIAPPDGPGGFAGLAVDTEVIRSDSEALANLDAHGEKPSTLVALRGPGGLPVFAALTSGDWHDDRDGAKELAEEPGGAVANLVVPALSCVVGATVPAPCANGAGAQGGFADQAAPRFAALSSIYVVSAVNSPYLDPVREDRRTAPPRRRSKGPRKARLRVPNGAVGSTLAHGTDSRPR